MVIQKGKIQVGGSIYLINCHGFRETG